jgi:hypothetical protein
MLRPIDVVGVSDSCALRDLPGHAPAVLAPAALTFLAAILHNCVPPEVCFGLVVGGDLELKSSVVLYLWAAIEADAGNTDHGELDGQHVTLLSVGIVAPLEIHKQVFYFRAAWITASGPAES